MRLRLLDRYVLSELLYLQIVQKVYPFGEDPAGSRRGIYRLADYCYNFWYRFVFQYFYCQLHAF